MSLTTAQQQAITARGNVLMVAGAGTGKTTTLVERCLYCLLDEKPPASLEQILMVTFTEATATDMRKKIRTSLEKKLKLLQETQRPLTPDGGEGENQLSRSDIPWLTEQLALFEKAHIGTLHSFCFELIKQHFYELELDPQLNVLPEEEAKLLADEIMEEIFQERYEGKTADAQAVQDLIQAHGRNGDKSIRALVLRLHHYAQTLRNPDGWVDAQSKMFASPEPIQWREWLTEAVAGWRDRWTPLMRSLAPENPRAQECAGILAQLPPKPSRKECARALTEVCQADLCDWPARKKTQLRAPMERFFKEAKFLDSLARFQGNADPLTEDWEWCRGQMKSLLELARSFTEAFSKQKRELGVADFHDLEQHALRLLWDSATDKPTLVAHEWRRKFRFVFVDEYQDINDAQDAILTALSGEGAAANRFLVGDVKQSIYRFRLADPAIFQRYTDEWRDTSKGKAIPLVDNFRSRESILKFVNSIFGSLMRREIGGVPYDYFARLKFGDEQNRAALSLKNDSTRRVELLLRLTGATEPATTDEDQDSESAWAAMANLDNTAKEARMIAMRLLELKKSRHEVWEESAKSMRAVEWRDMAVLLRSPSGKAETYAREFSRLGVPLTVARCGFYESIEITDLLSLLQLLDNPLQDLAALAVLHSPLVGMTLDELATVRLQQSRGHVWFALQRYRGKARENSGWAKADRFLKNFAKWRKLARQTSLSRCLEAVLAETHYADWLLTQPRGEQRHANVRRLLALAQEFDQFQRQGLFRFLHFIEAQQAADTEPQVAPVSGGDSVSLMSIHQSKGLEFPVVVAADLSKNFNLSDLRAEIILDSRYGLCPRIKPPRTGQRYPSLPYWLAVQHQRQETLGEELRLLYVAFTRARDTLILAGGVSENKFQSQWLKPSEITVASLLEARSYLDWFAKWSAQASETCVTPEDGENEFLSWKIFNDSDPRLVGEIERATEISMSASANDADVAAARKLRGHLEWQYPFGAAVREQAKLSVTTARQRIANETNDDAALRFKFQRAQFAQSVSTRNASRKLSAERIGLAHHAFLQLVDLEQTATVAGLQAEAKRLADEGALDAEESASLNLEALAQFWQSPFGTKIRANAGFVQRELEFTARFLPEEVGGNPEAGQFFSLAPTGGEGWGEGARSSGKGEFIVVQGAADLAVLLPKEIWLVDFKTDRMAAADLDAKVELYEPQLRIYAQALSRIYRRPVTQAHLHFFALGRSEELKIAK